MAKNNLTPDNIILIIKACAENNVSKFSVDTLAFEFGQPKIKDDVIITEPLTQVVHEKMDSETLVAEELKTRNEQMQMLLIENPLLAEEMIADGDLEDDESESGDGDGIEENG